MPNVVFFSVAWAENRNKTSLSVQEKQEIVEKINSKAAISRNAKGFIIVLDNSRFPDQLVPEFINSIANCVCLIHQIDENETTYAIAQNEYDLRKFIPHIKD